jgi:hypothetical protein
MRQNHRLIAHGLGGAFGEEASAKLSLPMSLINDRRRVRRVSHTERKWLAMPPTDSTNRVAGIYESDCKDRERITMPLGHQFPPCPTCGKAVNWQLVVATKQ